MFTAIVNASSRFSDQDALTATRAIAHQIRYHAAPAWQVHASPVVFLGHIDPATAPKDGSLTLPPNVPPGSCVLGLFDSDSEPDALGWHSEGPDGSIFGRVNVGAVLDAGGSPLLGPLTVASVLSHEVLEALVNPRVDVYVQRPDGALVAQEIGDPVESWWYRINVDGAPVAVSDFVTPGWFDDSPAAGTHTHWGQDPLAPFAIAKGGYAIVWDPNAKNPDGSPAGPQGVFGDEYPDWRRAMKGSRLSRTYRLTARG